MKEIIVDGGSLELTLVLPREERRARFEMTPTGDGWCLASETGTADDGTSRRLLHRERGPLTRELLRVVRGMTAAGYVIERLRLRRSIPAA
jgi:hypothetical protein